MTATPSWTPASGATPGPTATVAPLADRTSCAEIRGTDYRSDSERAWFMASCPSPTAPAASAASGAQGPPPLPPRDPFRVSFETLVASIVSETDALATSVAAPDFVDVEWRNETIGSAREIGTMSGVVAMLAPPNCLVAAHASIRAATFELGVATGLLVSAVEQNNLTLLRLAEQRLNVTRANLPLVQARVAAAEC
jgi:hypothetical protein